MGSEDMDLSEELRAEREARISRLEKQLRQRSGVGVKVPVALAGILMGAGLLYMQRLDVAYLLSPRAPLALGHEGDYRFELLTSNRYVQVHGPPTLRGAYSREAGETYVVVGLRDTPLLVRRRAFPHEAWRAGSTPPQPDQRPFAVGGRLLARGDARRYEDGFAKLLALGEVRPLSGELWIVLEGERPGANTGAGLLALVLVLFVALNAWFLWREVRHRMAVRAAATRAAGGARC